MILDSYMTFVNKREVDLTTAGAYVGDVIRGFNWPEMVSGQPIYLDLRFFDIDSTLANTNEVTVSVNAAAAVANSGNLSESGTGNPRVLFKTSMSGAGIKAKKRAVLPLPRIDLDDDGGKEYIQLKISAGTAQSAAFKLHAAVTLQSDIYDLYDDGFIDDNR